MHLYVAGSGMVGGRDHAQSEPYSSIRSQRNRSQLVVDEDWVTVVQYMKVVLDMPVLPLINRNGALKRESGTVQFKEKGLFVMRVNVP